MDHLSSCYFCGTAMDDPLQDYRLVPVELREDDAVSTVTLCSSCHAKLERLLGPVVEAAGESGATLDAVDSHSGSQGKEQDAGAVPEPDPLAGETASDGVAGDDELIEVDDGLGEDPLSTATGESERGESDVDTGESEPGEPDADSGEGETDEDARSDEGDDGDTDSDGDGGGGTGDENVEGGEDEETEASGDPAARTTVSALEYNKVMRLLQNREFPVDRAEIQIVAANAYGLAEGECADVIDLAIDRGLIDERDGQLVRPE